MRIKLSLAAAAVAALVTSTARADVFVYGDVEKFKTTDVFVTLDVDKQVDLYTFEWIAVDAVAETDIVKNQRNTHNFVEDENGDGLASIANGSFASASGIVLVNQAPGFANNQGNDVSVVHATSQDDGGSYRPVPSPQAKATPNDPEPDGVYYSNWPNESSVQEFVEVDGGVFVHAEAAVQQINAPGQDGIGSDSVATIDSAANVFVNIDPATYTNEIVGSGSGLTGIAGINQSAGHMNNQNNAVAVALGDESVYALGESALGQFNVGNYVDVVDQVRTDTIDSSFDGATGVVTVNQSSGSLNNQANVVSIAVGTSLLP